MGLGVLKLKMIWLDLVYDACGLLRIWDRLTGGIMVVVGGFWERLVKGFEREIKFVCLGWTPKNDLVLLTPSFEGPEYRKIGDVTENRVRQCSVCIVNILL